MSETESEPESEPEHDREQRFAVTSVCLYHSLLASAFVF
jgi:hypothetical protein